MKLLLLVLLLAASCSNTKTTQDNMLSEKETKDGWRSLFDGKTMNGWRTFQNKKSDSWTVADGLLHCKGSATDKSDLQADIITNEQYENFEFSIDWKIEKAGNTGIMYLVTEEFPTAYLSGPEYQVIDGDNFPEKLEDWQTVGANYAMHPAKDAKANPVGEWNNSKIVVNKGHVEHWLNDKKIVEYELWNDEWNKKKAEGKWKDTPGYGMAKKGHIALQDHGSAAWFRNAKVRVL